MADLPIGATALCRHCGERIVYVNWSWRPGWTHQAAGASFQDGVHEWCRRTRAAPVTA